MEVEFEKMKMQLEIAIMNILAHGTPRMQIESLWDLYTAERINCYSHYFITKKQMMELHNMIEIVIKDLEMKVSKTNKP